MTKLSDLKAIAEKDTSHWDTNFSVSQHDKEFYPIKVLAMILLLEESKEIFEGQESKRCTDLGGCPAKGCVWLTRFRKEFGQ